jgi:hypothetical protein
MPRKPTGKRVRREDGTYVVVNKAGNRAGSVFHVPSDERLCPTAASASDGRTGERRTGTRCRGASAQCRHLPVTR